MKSLLAHLSFTSLLFTLRLMGTDMNALDTRTLELYLERLNLSEEVLKAPKDHNLLNTLVRAHLTQIPFENLNMHTAPQTPILTSMQAITDKILRHQQGENRGGYCYEVNELFFQLLKTLGFEVKRHKASVWAGKDPDTVPWPSHQLSTVSIGDSVFLADVGFGLFNIFEAVKLPNALGETVTFTDSRGKIIKFEKVLFDAGFGPEQSGHVGYIYNRWSDSKQNFERVSTFTELAFENKDYLGHNDYVQYSYRAFIDNVMFTRFTVDGQMITCVKPRSGFENIKAILEWINEENAMFEKITL